MNSQEYSLEYLNKPMIFVIRLSAIGDTLIVTRAMHRLESLGFEPILITSPECSDIAKLNIFSKYVCIFNPKKNTDFKNQLEFWQRDSQNAFVQLPTENFNLKLNSIDVLDMQCTSRSRKCIEELASTFSNSKISTFKVEKRSFFRFFLLFKAYFLTLFTGQLKGKQFQFINITRIHDLQKETIDAYIKSSNKIIHLESTEKFSQILLKSTPQIEMGSKISKPFVALFPGASGPLKAWPKEQFRELINLILINTNFDVVICGGKGEISVAEYLHFPNNNRIINTTAKTTLKETLFTIAAATYIVTGDSFAAHAADLYNIPCSVIFGGTSPEFGFVPISPRIKTHYANLSCSPCTRHGKGQCRFRNLKCLTDISPSLIYSDIAALIIPIAENKI